MKLAKSLGGVVPRWVTPAVGGVPEVPSTGVSGWVWAACHSCFEEHLPQGS